MNKQVIHPFHRKSNYLVNPYRSKRPSTRLDIGRPGTLIAFELCTLTMAHLAATSMTGITTPPVAPGSPAATPTVIEVNIGDIMEQAKRLSVAVNVVGENNMRHMGSVSLAVDVVGSEYYDHLHEMTSTSLQRIQASLRVIHQQMTAYTSTMGPNAIEFQSRPTSRRQASSQTCTCRRPQFHTLSFTPRARNRETTHHRPIPWMR